MTQVLIAGGYGLVGHQVAQLLAERQPQLELLIGGRNPYHAAALVKRLPRAQAVRLDLDEPDPLASLSSRPDLVIVVANDSNDRLLRSAIEHGVALIDITRWTSRVRDALVWAATAELRAPLVLGSSWMAAIPASLAVEASRDFSKLTRIDLDILYALADRAGPNSVEYMDRMATAFEVNIDGHRTQRKPFSASRLVDFNNNHHYTTALFDSPDQITLPGLTGTPTVTTHIGFDHELSNHLLRGMVRSGLWRAISGPAFAGLRRKLLFNPGAGDHHRVRVSLQGLDAQGQPLHRIINLDDPAGQTHLTATGAVVQAERVIGRAGEIPPAAGVYYAEAIIDADQLRETLAAADVELLVSDSHP